MIVSSKCLAILWRFKTFAARSAIWSLPLVGFIQIPRQIVIMGRRVRWRILAYNPWLGPFFRLLDAIWPAPSRRVQPARPGWCFSDPAYSQIASRNAHPRRQRVELPSESFVSGLRAAAKARRVDPGL